MESSRAEPNYKSYIEAATCSVANHGLSANALISNVIFVSRHEDLSSQTFTVNRHEDLSTQTFTVNKHEDFSSVIGSRSSKL